MPSDSIASARRRFGSRLICEPKPGLADLTPAELRILRLIARNQTSKEIADALDLITRTVDNHRFNICTKPQLHGVHSLVKFAFENKSDL